MNEWMDGWMDGWMEFKAMIPHCKPALGRGRGNLLIPADQDILVNNTMAYWQCIIGGVDISQIYATAVSVSCNVKTACKIKQTASF